MNSAHTGEQRTSLHDEIKKYLFLRRKQLELITLEKGSLLLGHLLLLIACLILTGFAILSLSIALAIYLGTLIGSQVWAFLIVAGIYFVLIAFLIIFKYGLIINPMVRLLNRSLFTDTHIEQEIKDNQLKRTENGR